MLFDFLNWHRKKSGLSEKAERDYSQLRLIDAKRIYQKIGVIRFSCHKNLIARIIDLLKIQR